MEEKTGITDPVVKTERHLVKNFAERVREDWSHNPLSVVDTAAYVLLGLAAVKYLRSK